MKQYKEYPATHSMSTAWYVADEDGNVAIMDYNENGPVPWEIEQTSIEELVFGHEEDYKRKKYFRIKLTDVQIYDLLESSKDPSYDFNEWMLDYDAIVQIDKGQEKEFLKLLKNGDIEYYRCISKDLCLYMMTDCYHCFEDKREAIHKRPLKHSSLYKMLSSNMILKVYNTKNFYINDVMKDSIVSFDYKFKSAPYYIYKQLYWNWMLAERINIPEHPVKLDQFPEALRKRVHRVPIKFGECEKFQIAEWHPCKFTTSKEDDKYVNGCIYGLLPLTDGKEAYILRSMDEVDFYQYCSEKELYHCNKCTWSCASCPAHFFTDKPTIMTIVSPYSKYNYEKNVTSDIIVKKSVIMPFLPIIPKPINSYFTSIDEAKKVVTTRMLENLYLRNYKYLEDMVARYNPRAIIVDKKAHAALQKEYAMDNHVLKIAGMEYPLFFESEVEKHREELEHMAELPYRGMVFPHVISIEEMQKIEKERHD